MAVYIDVIVDISVNSLDRIFQYRVPEELLDAVTVGCQVNVPFGKWKPQTAGFRCWCGNRHPMMRRRSRIFWK